MKSWFVLFLVGMILLQSCTGQKPANLKNSTTHNRIKPECSSIVLQGPVLSQKNILNVFECSGWAKQYPELTKAIKQADPEYVDNAFRNINAAFFATKDQRKKMFRLISQAEDQGQLDQLALILEKGLIQHKLLGQFNTILNSNSLSRAENASLLKVLSTENDYNIKFAEAARNFLASYEQSKPLINGLFVERDGSELSQKVSVLINDLSQNMAKKDWNHLAGLLYNGKSALQKWTQEGLSGDLGVLLEVIEGQDFASDVKFLKDSIDYKVKCENRANETNFVIDVGHELEHKIDILKFGTLSEFEKTMLNGFTTFYAFQEFCEEKARPQGLDAFHRILKYVFKVLDSQHDYNFLKNMHQVYGEDRYAFLSFLNTQTFLTLREELTNLNKQNKDKDFVYYFYQVFADLPLKDLSTLSEMPHELTLEDSKTTEWFNSWSKAWLNLNPAQKVDFLNFLGVLISDDVDASKGMDFIVRLMKEFPAFSTELSTQLTDEQYQKDLKYVVRTLSADGVQAELGRFLSKKGLFEFLEIITQQSDEQNVNREPVRVTRSTRPLTYVDNRTPDTDSIRTRACFDSLSARYEKDTSYYGIVNDLPDNCRSVLGEIGFVGQIYLWMNTSHAYFKEQYQVGDFHSADGVWAPGMLQFIFSAAVHADLALKSKDGKTGLAANIDEIHRVVTHPDVLESFHLISKGFKQADNILKLDSRISKFFQVNTDAVLSQVASDGLNLLKEVSPQLDIRITKGDCKTLNPNLGVDPCLKDEQLKREALEILRITKRRNEKNQTLIQELIRWMHPRGGIDLPFNKPTKSHHFATIEEILYFLKDLNRPSTAVDFEYQSENKEVKVRGTTLERLEVVIRDIAFLNNFYGAYFKNYVGEADNYRKDVSSAEGLLKLLDASSPLMRGVHKMPKDTKWRLKNVKSTFTSLIEISDRYQQADGSVRSYGPFIQSLLTAIGTSSRLKTQKFNPYRIPEGDIVEGHNGLFLTKIVELSGLRHLSDFVKARFGNELENLDSPTFRQINNNLLARHDLGALQNGMQALLDKYLDNDRNQINLMIGDLVNFVSTMNLKEQKALEETAVKLFTLLSSPDVSTENIQTVAGLIDILVEKWPELHDALVKVENREMVILQVNRLLDGVVQNPSALNRLISTFGSSGLLTKSDLRNLLGDKNFLGSLIELLNYTSQMRGPQSDLNWIETFDTILGGKGGKWEPIKRWLAHSIDTNQKNLTVSLLVEFLGQKEIVDQKPVYRFKGIMDELFYNHRQMLDLFLQASFGSLHLAEEQKAQ